MQRMPRLGQTVIHTYVLRIAFVLCFVSALCCVSTAQEFKIESQIYTADSNLPVSQNVTLFSEGIVYDFRLSMEAVPQPLEVVVFDARQRKTVLLDPARMVKLDLLDIRVLKILEAVRRETQQDNRSSFLVSDTFTETADWSSNWVTLESPKITYRFHGSRPVNVDLLKPYMEFLDSATQLIASDPHKIPPFPRMRLNRSIRKLGWLPTEVHVDIKPNPLFKNGLSAKSKHTIINTLSDKDRERIKLAKAYWLRFDQVDLASYRGFAEPDENLLDKIQLASYDEAVKIAEQTSNGEESKTTEATKTDK